MVAKKFDMVGVLPSTKDRLKKYKELRKSTSMDSLINEALDCYRDPIIDIETKCKEMGDIMDVAYPGNFYSDITYIMKGILLYTINNPEEKERVQKVLEASIVGDMEGD